MATDAPVNGTYGQQGGFDQSAGYTNSASSGQPSYSNGASNQAPSSGATQEIPKDEVGWYFVEQYYTTLSRSPEKLYLFYNKRSQFVLGNEADKVAVCVGQKAINEHIKDLDFRDCKVRVTNVDSQASDSNIVIQVIGEISNKSQPHKKFTQTFVLAGQTNGYFVLNDIFRYIIEEEVDAAQNDDEQTQRTAAASGFQEPAPTAASEPVAETLSSSEDPSAIEQSAKKVDQELEQKVLKPEPTQKADPPAGAVNGTPAPAEDEIVQASDAPVGATPAIDEPAQSTTQDVQAQTLQPEEPKDPEPTPAISPVKEAAQPAPAASPAQAPAQAPAPAPSKPSAPKSWASLAAAAHKPAPAVPAPQKANSAATPQPKAAPAPVNAPATSATPSDTPAASVAAPAEASAAKQEDEWTSVGDHKKQQKGAQAAVAAQEGPQTRAYIKNVGEALDVKELRTALEKFGEITYFDVHRQKNCAFVDFKTPEAYKAAVDANPHQIGNDRVVVEERRTKPGMPFAPRGGARGGGRGGQAQGGRGSFQGGRGGFAGRGRGGANAPRGRGGAPQAAQ